MLEERRQHPRLVPNSPTFVSLDHSRSGLLLNAGEGGIAVASLLARSLDDVISVAFELPDGHGSIQAEAEIAWTRDEGHLTGARFLNVDEHSLRQLCDWISTSPKVEIVTRETALESYPEQLILPVEEESAEPVIDEAITEERPEEETVETADTDFEHLDEEITEADFHVAEEMPLESTDQVSQEASQELGELATEAASSVEAMSSNEKEENATPASVTTSEFLTHSTLNPLTSASVAGVSEPSVFVTRSSYPHVDPIAQAMAPTPGVSDSYDWQPMPEKRKQEAEAPSEVGWLNGTTKGRHTIELILAVVVLSWALVYLGYQMGSTGVNRQNAGGSSAIAAASEMPGATAKGSESPSQGLVPSVQASPALPRETPSSSGALGDAGVVLQVGAMKMEDNADTLARQLQKKDMPAFVFRHGPDGLYHVAVGPFSDDDTTARMRAKLERQGLKPIVRRWLPQ